MRFFYKFFKLIIFLLCYINLISADFSLFEPEKKIYKIATDINFPPFEFRDENGELKGIEIDLLKALAEDQNFEYEILELGFQNSLEALNKGEVDMVFASVDITEERKKKYDFSLPYFTTSVSLAVEKTSTIKSYKDLEGKVVSVKRGTTSNEFIKTLSKKHHFFVFYLDDSLNLTNDVTTHLSDACFEDTAFLKYSIANGLDMKLPMKEEGRNMVGAIVRKGENKELLNKINTGLLNLKENGTYEKIIDEYL